MILTKPVLKQYIKNMKISLPDIFVNVLLDKYGKLVPDGDGHMVEYSEQDIAEQMRKDIQKYLEGGKKQGNS